jgi:hypothetical protein
MKSRRDADRLRSVNPNFTSGDSAQRSRDPVKNSSVTAGTWRCSPWPLLGEYAEAPVDEIQ